MLAGETFFAKIVRRPLGCFLNRDTRHMLILGNRPDVLAALKREPEA